MKRIIILGDGMADQPCDALGGLTPLQAADTPAMDRLAARGRSGLLVTVPEGFTPGSEIANMSILGYDPRRVYQGRGVLEAAAMGVDVAPGEIAFRCNLVSVTPDGRLLNHSAGHISTDEGAALIRDLAECFASEFPQASFHPGVSYRHLLKIKDGSSMIDCAPPHDKVNSPVASIMPAPLSPESAPHAALLCRMIERSRSILASHPVNADRRLRGLPTADLIWPWSPGQRPEMEPMSARFPMMGRGAVITAVDLIRGIGVYAGLDVIRVEGATGLYDTDYEAKVRAAIRALSDGYDFVYLHVEASDEAGHEGDLQLKLRTVTDLDHRVVAPLLRHFDSTGEPVTIALLPDHPTPVAVRTHTSDPVPFTIFSSGITPDRVSRFSESDAAQGSLGLLTDDQFINLLFNP